MPPRIAEALTAAVGVLGPAQRLDSEVMLSDALQQSRAYVLAHPEEELSDAATQRFEDAVARRSTGEPLAYIRGSKELYGRSFIVTPDTLIPRPETEELIDLIKPTLDPKSSVWDIGTGSGCIAITLALETSATLSGFDISTTALTIAQKNADQLGASVTWGEADMLPAASETPDVIVANLPYLTPAQIAERSELAFEPRAALDGGADGFDLVRRLLDETPPQCIIYLEIDPSHEAPLSALTAWRCTLFPSLGGEVRFARLTARRA